MRESDKKPAPIIIVKKRAQEYQHHGAAWKVAYADFVTAMMALFIVLWLLSCSEKVKSGVSGYFQDPTGEGRQSASINVVVAETLNLNKDNLQQLKDKLETLLRRMPTFNLIGGHIRMMVTREGLRIDLMETQRGMFFENADPKPTRAGEDLLKVLSRELAKLPNKVAIEGHTDANPFGRSDYSNWELSADRANSARRIMQAGGLRADQISQVRGFADQRLLTPKNPKNPSNRRISIIVRDHSFDLHEQAMMKAAAASRAEEPAPVQTTE